MSTCFRFGGLFLSSAALTAAIGYPLAWVAANPNYTRLLVEQALAAVLP